MGSIGATGAEAAVNGEFKSYGQYLSLLEAVKQEKTFSSVFLQYAPRSWIEVYNKVLEHPVHEAWDLMKVKYSLRWNIVVRCPTLWGNASF